MFPLYHNVKFDHGVFIKRVSEIPSDTFCAQNTLRNADIIYVYKCIALKSVSFNHLSLWRGLLSEYPSQQSNA